MLKIISWHWNGWRANEYSIESFNILDRMLKANLSIDYDFAVVTDDPKNPKYSMRTIPFPHDKKLKVNTRQGRPNCLCRLKMFDRNSIDLFGKEGDHIVSMDVDVIIMKNIDSLFLKREEFKSLKGFYVPYSGGMIMHELGKNSILYDNFEGEKSLKESLREMNTETNTRYAGSDQAWISNVYKNSQYPRWSVEDGCYSVTWNRFLLNNRVPENCLIVQTPGSRKPMTGGLRSFNQAIYDEYRKYMVEDMEFEEGFYKLRRKSIYGKEGDSILLESTDLIKKLRKRQII